MRRWTRLLGVTLVAFGCALTPSCIATSPGASQVAQGQLYQSGEPLYDEFFQQLHTAQVAMQEAPADESRIRGELAQALTSIQSASGGSAGSAAVAAATSAPGGAEESAGDEKSEGDAGGDPTAPAALAAAVRQRVEAIAWRAKLSVEITGELGDEGVTVELAWVGKPRMADRELGQAIEQALSGELSVLARMRQHRAELERLGSMAQGLEKNADSVFRRAGLAKRAEVKKNLRDAQVLIPLMEGRAQEVTTLAERLARQLRATATAEQGPPAPAPPPAPEAPSPRPVTVPHRPAAPTKAAPPRSAAPAGDFEP